TALFSLIGTTYGGDGIKTFALPNLQSRVPLHFGQGPGLSTYALGQVQGNESVTLTTSQMPSHTHAYSPQATTGAGHTGSPAPGPPPRPPGACGPARRPRPTSTRGAPPTRPCRPRRSARAATASRTRTVSPCWR